MPETSSDFLTCKHIAVHVNEGKERDVRAMLSMSLSVCAEDLNISLSGVVVDSMITDILKTYKFESVEDILEVIKKGRQGYYGTSYRQLNMMVIQEWMSYHLEQKAIDRENQHSAVKESSIKNDLSPEEIIKFYQSGKEYHKKQKEIQRKYSGLEKKSQDFAKAKAEWATSGAKLSADKANKEEHRAKLVKLISQCSDEEVSAMLKTAEEENNNLLCEVINEMK